MKKIKRYKAEKPLPYLEGDYLDQAVQIATLLYKANDVGYVGRKKEAEKKINEAYIHLSRLVHSM